ncbi:chloramphenicol-sensitive protein RarD [Actinocorallia herbida]|uniref:Chloramphenicol-sensitive protein RarD n=1 Tax=Actinocorallia herbida TaxID=58109 RepID=A0A3N1D9V3_9ACTN|nr:EamA family transporter RarD [Actinocorallia herbida]ROO90290.1 chloramphenicol-sensitive protein RarD [Actinocorallia herbida]
METRRGLAAGLAAYVIWGLFPLYFPLLKPSSAGEVLAHRIVWTLVTMGLLLAFARRWAWVKAVTGRQWAALSAAAVLIAVNWGTYILAVNDGKTIEASLGYFITPLFSVLLGVVLLKERLRPWQWTAVGIGVLAVVILTLDYGRPPWIALILTFTFGIYGLLKKRAAMPSAESMAIESAVLFVPAAGFAVWTQADGSAAFGHHGAGHVLLILALGIVTAAPLMLFNTAAQALPLSTVGLLQYLAPVLQFSVGLFVQHELMPGSRWTGFGLVWFALAILTFDAFRTARRSRAATPVTAAA